MTQLARASFPASSAPPSASLALWTGHLLAVERSLLPTLSCSTHQAADSQSTEITFTDHRCCARDCTRHRRVVILCCVGCSAGHTTQGLEPARQALYIPLSGIPAGAFYGGRPSLHPSGSFIPWACLETSDLPRPGSLDQSLGDP